MTNTHLTPQDRTTLKVLYSMMFTESKRRYPDHPLPPKPFDVRKTSQLEGAICKWFQLYGYKAERVHVQGRLIGSDVVTYNTITGKRQAIDKAKYVPSTGAKGTADISVTCRNKEGAVMSLRIEVKNGYTNDRVRPDQIKYKQQHEAAGGTYIVIHYFSEFIEWANQNVLLTTKS